MLYSKVVSIKVSDIVKVGVALAAGVAGTLLFLKGCPTNYQQPESVIEGTVEPTLSSAEGDTNLAKPSPSLSAAPNSKADEGAALQSAAKSTTKPAPKTAITPTIKPDPVITLEKTVADFNHRYKETDVTAYKGTLIGIKNYDENQTRKDKAALYIKQANNLEEYFRTEGYRTESEKKRAIELLEENIKNLIAGN
jgi:hypothetical protein